MALTVGTPILYSDYYTVAQKVLNFRSAVGLEARYNVALPHNPTLVNYIIRADTINELESAANATTAKVINPACATYYQAHNGGHYAHCGGHWGYCSGNYAYCSGNYAYNSAHYTSYCSGHWAYCSSHYAYNSGTHSTYWSSNWGYYNAYNNNNHGTYQVVGA